MAFGPNPPNEKITQQHLMFGVVDINGESRPVLQKQATEEDACTECRGYGHRGNPLCGAIYTCQACKGSGIRQPGQPPYVPKAEKKEEPAEAELTTCPSPPWWWWAALILAVTLLVTMAL